jgi:hypothetical protein
MFSSVTFVKNASQILEVMRNESKHRAFSALLLMTATHILHIEWLINAIGIRA